MRFKEGAVARDVQRQRLQTASDGSWGLMELYDEL